MLNFHSGVSASVNSTKAVKESLGAAVGEQADDVNLVILHSTMGHKFEQLVSTAKEVCPNAEIVGCTGSGVIGTDWVSEAMRALAVMTVSGSKISTECVSGVTAESSYDVARNCAEQLSKKLANINILVAFGPGLNVDGGAIIDGIESVFGQDVPIGGCLGGFSGDVIRTPIFHSDTVYDDALVLIGFADPTLSMVQGAHHGCLPSVENQFTVTKSEGIRVDELDGKPAWPVLMDSLGLPHETTPIEVILLISLGVELPDEDRAEYNNDNILRAPLYLSEDGNSFFMQHEIPTGTTIVSCQRNEDHIFAGIDNLTTQLKKREADRELVAVFHADCMARGRMGHGVVEKGEIVEKIQHPLIVDDVQAPLMDDNKRPWLGVYGFAEFCTLNGRNTFHNYTTSLSMIVRG